MEHRAHAAPLRPAPRERAPIHRPDRDVGRSLRRGSRPGHALFDRPRLALRRHGAPHDQGRRRRAHLGRPTDPHRVQLRRPERGRRPRLRDLPRPVPPLRLQQRAPVRAQGSARRRTGSQGDTDRRRGRPARLPDHHRGRGPPRPARVHAPDAVRPREQHGVPGRVHLEGRRGDARGESRAPPEAKPPRRGVRDAHRRRLAHRHRPGPERRPRPLRRGSVRAHGRGARPRRGAVAGDRDGGNPVPRRAPEGPESTRRRRRRPVAVSVVRRVARRAEPRAEGAGERDGGEAVREGSRVQRDGRRRGGG